MAGLAKPKNELPFIGAEESSEFIDEFNKNKISDELLKSCEKAGKLFKDEETNDGK